MNWRSKDAAHLEGVTIRILLYGLLALLAVLLGYFGRNLTLSQAALVFLSSIILLLGMTYLTLRIHDDRFKRRLLRDLLPVLDAYKVENSLVKDASLLSGPSLDEYEAACGANRIIVASANLDHDVPGARVYETVKLNLQRGKRYIYLIPDTPAMRTKAGHSQAGLGWSGGQLLYLAFDPEKVAGLTDTNLAAYYSADGEVVVFTELAVDPDPNKRFWARLHRDYAYQVAGRLEMLASSAEATWRLPEAGTSETGSHETRA